SRPKLRIGAVVALAAAAGFAAWLAVGRTHDTTSGSASSTVGNAVPISLSGLKTLGSALNRSIYWAGVHAGSQYELTQASDGRVWIRYLPAHEKIGEQATPYLTIG